MQISLIYDSEEWSNNQIYNNLRTRGLDINKINLQKESIDYKNLLKSKMVINRVFPSSLQRGNLKAYKESKILLKEIYEKRIFMINSYEAYLNDFSKIRTYGILKKENIPVPETHPLESLTSISLNVPFIIKPDCSGRSKNTFIIKDKAQVSNFKIPRNSEMILQRFISPDLGFTTRVEILGNEVMVILKRFVNHIGMSSYHTGSKYEHYNDLNPKIIDTSLKALKLLKIDMGSLDIIETRNKEFFIIDVNATSNFSEDNISFLGFDPIKKFSDYIYKRYLEL